MPPLCCPKFVAICTNILNNVNGVSETKFIFSNPRYTTIPDSIEAMEATLRWGHMAPTCPDTLYGYPMPDKDLLLFQTSPTSVCKNESIFVPVSPDYPDVFVAGNQETFGCRRANKTDGSGALLVSVPRFDTTQTVAIVDLDSLRCLPLRFHLEGFHEEDKGKREQHLDTTDCFIDSSDVGEKS